MRARTLLVLARAGRLRLLLAAARMPKPFYRVCWLASAAKHGVLSRLAAGRLDFDRLARDLAPDAEQHAALRAWLDVGARLGELESGPAGYSLRGRMARALAAREQDDVAAVFEEVATLHHALLLDTPERLRRGRAWTLADQDGVLVARSSRVAEPLVREAIDRVLQESGAARLLEVGAGSATYIRYAAQRNPELEALGLELQEDVARLAAENLREWGIAGRVRIETGDVRARAPEAAFDVVTLHNNIYYFRVEERVALLRHLRGFLRPGGCLLVTTGCQGGSVTMELLNLWAAATRGCGRLPEVEELLAQLREAGFARVRARRATRGESYYAFTGEAPG